MIVITYIDGRNSGSMSNYKTICNAGLSNGDHVQYVTIDDTSWLYQLASSSRHTGTPASCRNEIKSVWLLAE